MTSKPIKLLVGAGLAIIALTLLNPFVIINAGHRGVVTNLGKVQTNILGEGVHFRTPFFQTVHKLEVRTVVLDVETAAYSKDTQAVTIKMALNYHLTADKVNLLYQEIGTAYQGRIIEPAVDEILKSIIATRNAQELLSERALVTAEIRGALYERLTPRHINVDDIAIRDFSFSDQYEKAVEAKQQAQQEALKAENDLKRIEFEAKQKVETARAEAEAIRIKAQAITQQGGKDYVQLQAIDKWNGQLPTHFIPGSTVPFLSL